MKATIVAAAAAVLAGGASAHGNHRHAHRALFEKRGAVKAERDVCVPSCTTIYSTIYGEPTWVQPPPKPVTPTAEPVVEVPTTTEAPVVAVPTATAPPTVPEPITEICPTPGTYTFPAKTIVVTETTTVCGATSTEVPAGTHTLGGVTTVVETATTVVCPVATTETQNGVVTSVIKTTTYVCPSAGTYTIAPITTVVPSVTTVVVPVVTTYCPGTYTAPALTTTVTETNYVVVCPFTSSEAPALAQPTSAPQEAPEAAPQEAPKETPQAPVPAGLGAKNGDLWAMTYTPFRTDGTCKSKQEVDEDVAKIKGAGFEALRIYSTDCDTLPNVGGAARDNGLRLIIGIFIGQKGCDNGNPTVAAQISALKAWKQWDLVDLCVVGNEALFNQFCSVGELAALISHTKSELGSVGYNGPFSTTDVMAAYQNNDVSSICSLIDVLTINAHAYFNYETTPDKAGDFVKGQIDIAAEICGKPAYCMETGWPTAGVCNGVACPGVEAQRTALASIRQVVGPKVTFFSFHDDNWKEPGACGCERSWGSSSCFGA
ncbi:exo-beta-1,3-glucanase [Cladorrhinum samala]|uniref:Probable beta-glucosidase btgE n=1 Tax=Cladorrhinum samala TaxID=585594 RepID=A0AAV9I0D4_9PEZI|nr:exo-beta-1,3-glucanase [Cladorrhinum samala]